MKYVVRPETARRLVTLLGSDLDRDPHAVRHASGAYTVRSVYFDSPSLECYRLKTGGQLFREKYRVRTYDEPGSAPLQFELKQKRGSRYRKHKLPLDARVLAGGAGASLLDWIPGPQGGDAEVARQRLLYRLRARSYRPVVLVTYEREAYVGRQDDTVRVTLDRHVRARACSSLSSIYDESRWTRPLGDWVIVEVKFTRRVPRWMGALHRHGRLKPQACSKYCTAVAALFGEESRVRVRHA